MTRKKGTFVPMRGTIVHLNSADAGSASEYAAAVAAALRQELGDTGHAIKSVQRWTGASERTVKYWFSGARGPSGHHLIVLARHSDAVLAAFLNRARREGLVGKGRLSEVRDRLHDLLVVLQDALNAEPDERHGHGK